ncbi:hypothetical protein C0J52_00606, partial [Blattella germanica]
RSTSPVDLFLHKQEVSLNCVYHLWLVLSFHCCGLKWNFHRFRCLYPSFNKI